MVLCIGEILDQCLWYVFTCQNPMEFMDRVARVNQLFLAATRKDYLVELKTWHKRAKRAYFDLRFNTAIESFEVTMVVNGKRLPFVYEETGDIWVSSCCQKCVESLKDSEITLELVNTLTQEKLTLQSVRRCDVFHREMLYMLDGHGVVIDYKIMPQKQKNIEVKIVGGSNRYYMWTRTAGARAITLFNFLVQMKQTRDGRHRFMTSAHMTKLKAKNLPLFAVVIVNGVNQPMKRVRNSWCASVNSLFLEVDAQGLNATTNVNVMFFVELIDTKELVPLIVAKIWNNMKYINCTFCVTINKIDQENNIVVCELKANCEDEYDHDIKFIVDTLYAAEDDQ